MSLCLHSLWVFLDPAKPRTPDVYSVVSVEHSIVTAVGMNGAWRGPFDEFLRCFEAFSK
jgi:hypothetical protein